jgi:hypothetical protein
VTLTGTRGRWPKTSEQQDVSVDLRAIYESTADGQREIEGKFHFSENSSFTFEINDPCAIADHLLLLVKSRIIF